MITTEEIEKLPIFFIVGRERSGTTLLQTILDNHPNIIIPTEAQFIRHLYNKYHKIKYWDELLIKSFCNDLLDENYIQLWKLDKDKLFDNLITLKGECSFATICKAIYFCSVSAIGKDKIILLGDKNPPYSLFIKELLSVFPTAKFIYITRDYRDHIVSMVDSHFDSHTISTLAYRWKYYNANILKNKNLYPSSFYHIRYENLVQNPEEEIKKITSFLNVSFAEELLNNSKRAKFYDENKLLITKHHEQLLKPISTQKINVWEKRLKDSEVKTAEFVTGKFAEQFGYKRKFKKTSILLFFTCFVGVIKGWLFFPLYRFFYFLPIKFRKKTVDILILPNTELGKEAVKHLQKT